MARTGGEAAPAEQGGSGEKWRLGLLLFLVSVGTFFATGLVAYLILHLRRSEPPPAHLFQLPRGLWLSTLLLLGASYTLRAAARNLGAARRQALQRWLQRSFWLGAAFIGVQAPCIVQLFRGHRALLAKEGLGIYGLGFVLIALHALHVLGGALPLGWLAHRAQRGLVGTEHLAWVRACALYWHFLGGVWIATFAVLLFTI